MTPAAPPVRDLLDLRGHVALVTGAGAGIGTGIAARLAEAGAHVAVHYHRSDAGAREVVSRITTSGGTARAYQADLTAAAAVHDLHARITADTGVPDILVNNAGTYPLGSILDVDAADWQAVVTANLTSVHLVTQAVARGLRDAGRGGAIVNIASIEASNVAPAHSHYAAAKAGVVMYTKSAARELGALGIRVNAVSPGLIWRAGLDQAWPQGVSAYTDATPLGRLGRFEDVADACLFLVSAASRWITGTDLVVDGGVLTNRAY
ncbi:3-oxoacyl-[acyl-carrier-protein] reductase FabG [Luteitalea pratensis]|uniref:3-oxoacyl-[acyl-carrier-protein] reductase FabG n=1 Tax=Luteitalea pratensis TaxID=1855912 RepID=A0A143PHM2_LUTPR|nr:SDR family oxidoreductase [Luteitalea pratensis]AMY07249.1 3-oxoacyl-[acyl-carrier-protein] reductase FabG [Luteitalea pratensis]